MEATSSSPIISGFVNPAPVNHSTHRIWAPMMYMRKSIITSAAEAQSARATSSYFKTAQKVVEVAVKGLFTVGVVLPLTIGAGVTYAIEASVLLSLSLALKAQRSVSQKWTGRTASLETIKKLSPNNHQPPKWVKTPAEVAIYRELWSAKTKRFLPVADIMKILSKSIEQNNSVKAANIIHMLANSLTDEVVQHESGLLLDDSSLAQEIKPLIASLKSKATEHSYDSFMIGGKAGGSLEGLGELIQKQIYKHARAVFSEDKILQNAFEKLLTAEIGVKKFQWIVNVAEKLGVRLSETDLDALKSAVYNQEDVGVNDTRNQEGRDNNLRTYGSILINVLPKAQNPTRLYNEIRAKISNIRQRKNAEEARVKAERLYIATDKARELLKLGKQYDKQVSIFTLQVNKLNENLQKVVKNRDDTKLASLVRLVDYAEEKLVNIDSNIRKFQQDKLDGFLKLSPITIEDSNASLENLGAQLLDNQKKIKKDVKTMENLITFIRNVSQPILIKKIEKKLSDEDQELDEVKAQVESEFELARIQFEQKKTEAEKKLAVAKEKQEQVAVTRKKLLSQPQLASDKADRKQDGAETKTHRLSPLRPVLSELDLTKLNTSASSNNEDPGSSTERSPAPNSTPIPVA